ncbi:MAG TPA: hypothetical protein VK153_00680 [Candidatus Paceibacterota bacterium]|nr:hypothetical protein [Candidatus Paceibacterota bacterium]
MASYDYNTQGPPDEDNDSRGDEISAHPVSPLENLNLGVGDSIGNAVSEVAHVAGKVVGAGFSVLGKLLGR